MNSKHVDARKWLQKQSGIVQRFVPPPNGQIENVEIWFESAGERAVRVWTINLHESQCSVLLYGANSADASVVENRNGRTVWVWTERLTKAVAIHHLPVAGREDGTLMLLISDTNDPDFQPESVKSDSWGSW